MELQAAHFEWDSFFRSISGPRPRALLLDYDGTLAPFQVERGRAVLPPEIRDALQEIIGTGRTRLVLISGRALRDLIPLLALDPLPELWGSHGWERRLPDGRYLSPELEPAVADALETARRRVETSGLAALCELKPTGLAVHWRGQPPNVVAEMRAAASDAWKSLARQPGLALHEFDGGLELRAAGRDKGYAVRCILDELPAEALVVYAGDDVTDEDAFRALAGRGVSILVRPEYRQTAADIWLAAPREWLRFLNDWLTAERSGTQDETVQGRQRQNPERERRAKAQPGA